jgi:hypothetical protein
MKAMECGDDSVDLSNIARYQDYMYAMTTTAFRVKAKHPHPHLTRSTLLHEEAIVGNRARLQLAQAPKTSTYIVKCRRDGAPHVEQYDITQSSHTGTQVQTRKKAQRKENEYYDWSHKLPPSTSTRSPSLSSQTQTMNHNYRLRFSPSVCLQKHAYHAFPLCPRYPTPFHGSPPPYSGALLRGILYSNPFRMRHREWSRTSFFSFPGQIYSTSHLL